LDRITIEDFGVPGMKLMERAGSAAFTALRTRWPRAVRMAVLCGTGNNGGDGYVVARLADAAGMRVKVYQLGDTNRLKGDALTAYERLEGTHVDILPYDPEGHSFEMFDVVVDAMLGTGLQGAVKKDWAKAIDGVNAARTSSKAADGTAIVAIDIPSGLHADTGRVLGTAIKADLTATFIGMKQGLLTAAGPEYCGEILFDGLQAPSEAYTTVPPSAQRANVRNFAAQLAPRPRTAHKNQSGHVLLVGGNHGMTGAIRMASEAAGRSGAGLVSVATRAEYAPLVNIDRPELMSHGVSGRRDLLPLLEKANVVALGPGLGRDEWAKTFFAALMQCRLPMVLDADALNLLAVEPQQGGHWVLTPHPGEAARLLDCSPADIQADRFAAADAIHKRYGGVCVLKGAGTVVSCDPGGLYVCDAGNPGMASGGMGDILTGVVAGLLAQGLSLSDAALCGVCVHAGAADLAAAGGERGMLATDLFPHIRRLVNPQ
jgi:NAD(P)H-hydrate epimerase